MKPIFGSALAVATGAALLARQAVSRSSQAAQSAVEILPPLRDARLPELPSVSGATADLASALGRTGMEAAHDALDRWRRVSPKLQETASDMQRQAVGGIADLASSALGLIVGRRNSGGFLDWFAPRPSMGRRAGMLLSNAASDRHRVAQATTLLAFAALIVWLSKADRPTR